MQTVKKRLKTLDKHALKFCKQALFFSDFCPKAVFHQKNAKQDFGGLSKSSPIQNYDC